MMSQKDRWNRRKRYLDQKPDPLQLRECPQHKLAYKSEKRAKQAAAKGANLNGFKLHAYRCPYCRWFHLTKRMPRTQAK